MGRTASLQLTRRYQAPPAAVWAALTDSESLARWLGAVQGGAVTPGAELELTVGATKVAVMVRGFEPERRLELDWSPPGEPPSIVRFDLLPEGHGTTLVLAHTHLDEPSCMRAAAAWTDALSRIEEPLRAAAPR